MKRITMLGTALLLAVLAVPTARAQSGADLFQQGLKKERVDGDLKAAIAVYERVAKDYSKDHGLAARALVQLGGAYEKLGNAQAKSAYERVIRDYGEQSEQAALARGRLNAISASASLASRSEPVVRRIWSGADVDPEGSPTLDGKLLTFVDWGTGDLAVRDLVTGQNRRLTNKGPWTKSVAFALSSVPSRDGKRVAYTWYPDSGNVVLRVVGIEGGEPKVVYTNPEVDYVQPHDWSPDGTQILTLISRKDHTTQIALVNATDATVRVLKTLSWPYPLKMSFSPDGKYIAYDFPPREDADQRDIYVLASDGSSESVLVSHPANEVVAGWSPDDNYVLFASNRTGNTSLWLAPVKNGKPAGEPQLVRRDFEISARSMSFTQGGSFFYGADASPKDVYIASIDAASGKVRGTPTRLVDQYVGANSGADWSHDGRFVVYASKRRPGPPTVPASLVIRSVATDAERILPVQLSSYLGTARWSPDNQYLIVGGRDQKGRTGSFRVDPATGATTMMVEARDANRYLAGWSADGRSLIYRELDFTKPTYGIVMQPVEGGEPHDVFRVTGKHMNITQAQVSPDAKEVVFSLLGVDGSLMETALMVVPTSGGKPREIVRLNAEQFLASVAWSSDGRYLFYGVQRYTTSPDGSFPPSDEKMRLMRVPVAGGAPVETGLVVDAIADIRALPDGQRISFTSGKGASEVWVMENFLPGPQRPAATKKR